VILVVFYFFSFFAGNEMEKERGEKSGGRRRNLNHLQ